jgi:hypothetical protein
LIPAAKAAGPLFALEALEPRLLLTITEPNNSIAQAYNLGTLSSTQSISDSVGPSDLNDYIKFTTPAAGTVNLTLTGLTANADLQLLDSAGTPLVATTSAGASNEHIGRLLAGGTYYARVSGVSTATNYNLAFGYAAQTLTSHFAVIGDYGLDGPNELAVANMVKSWNPDFIATLGDNNYQDGFASTIDANIGKYYHDYIFNYQGIYGAGSPTRRFFPAIGNHEYGSSDNVPSRLTAYTNYFDLPGNERYYDYVQGPVHFFVINSDGNEPDGNDVGTIQANWLQAGLGAATEPFKIVYFHHPAYSSGGHGNNEWMQWPFAQWGATAVLSGHDHDYERLNVDGLTYFVNGVGGAELSPLVSIDPGVSQYQLAGSFGAMQVNVSGTAMTFDFYTADGALQDRYTLDPLNPRNDVTLTASDTDAAEPSGNNGGFTLTRAGSTTSALTVNYTITGTATNGGDYQTITTSATIPAGQSSVNIPITILNDSIGESDETVTLTLAPSSNYNVASSWTGTVTIHDDDVTRSTIFPAGSTWRYWDKGTDLGTTWRNLAFNDSVWNVGLAQLGYGDGDEATVVSYGGNSSNKYITTYFRRTFTLANGAAVSGFDLGLLIDDGAVIYINGNEVARYNMPGGAINYQTLAATNVGGAAESAFHDIPVTASGLATGTNIITVEVHQSVQDSSDLSFDLKMDALIDTGKPDPPTKPDLADASDSGISSSDDTTNVTTPTFTGTAEPGSTVKLFDGATQIGSVTAAAGTGIWQIISTALSNGPHTITATATDPAGNTSNPSAALALVIDIVAPTVSAGSFLFDNNHSITFQFNEDVSGSLGADDLSVRRQGDLSDVSTAGVTRGYATNLATFTFPTPLANGTYHGKLLTAGVTDAAGNAISSDGGFDFFVLAGDGNRSGTVEILDFNIIATNFGKSGKNFREGNYDYGADGKVDLLDFNILASNFGKQVTVPTAPASIIVETALTPTLPDRFPLPSADDDALIDVLNIE